MTCDDFCSAFPDSSSGLDERLLTYRCGGSVGMRKNSCTNFPFNPARYAPDTCKVIMRFVTSCRQPDHPWPGLSEKESIHE